MMTPRTSLLKGNVAEETDGLVPNPCERAKNPRIRREGSYQRRYSCGSERG